jgi:hypothetical protein
MRRYPLGTSLSTMTDDEVAAAIASAIRRYPRLAKIIAAYVAADIRAKAREAQVRERG